jgi:hypothetical protein
MEYVRESKYDLYVVSGGYLPLGRSILVQVSLGDTPELEPEQTAHKVTGGWDTTLSVDLLCSMFDDSAEGDNFHHLCGVAGTFADAIEEAEGESIAQWVLYSLAIRYEGIQEMGW